MVNVLVFDVLLQSAVRHTLTTGYFEKVKKAKGNKWKWSKEQQNKRGSKKQQNKSETDLVSGHEHLLYLEYIYCMAKK